MRDVFSTLFQRDLTRLSQEIAAYPDEAGLWQLADGIQNSAGTLCLHVVGNLNMFVGNVLGHSGYVRDRAAEFSTRDVPRVQLQQQVHDTARVVTETLARLSAEQLLQEYPTPVLGYPMTTQHFLLHLLGHLNYHLGQIDYHRRLLTGGTSVSFVS